MACTLVLGGARSGKSSYASALALAACPRPVYVATARMMAGDLEFESRVALHKQDRGDSFDLIECEKVISQHAETFRGRVVVVDCLTLWLTNFFMDAEWDGAAALAAAKTEFDRLVSQWDTTLILVSNELGSGVHAETKIGRDFVDAQGWLNQHVARAASRVVLMVAGQPLQVKPSVDHASSTPVPPKLANEAAMIDQVHSTRRFAMDPNGYFIVRAHAREQELVLEFHSSKTDDKGNVLDPISGERIACDAVRAPTRVLRGRTAKDVQVKLFDSAESSQLVTSTAHACYLGRELQRAEFALTTGTEYVQD